MIQIVTFLSVTLFIFSIISFFYWLKVRKEQAIRERLNKFEKPGAEKRSPASFILRKDELSEIPSLNYVLKRFRFAHYLRMLLDQAGISMQVGKLVLLMLSAAAIGLLFTLRSHNPLLSILSVVAFGAMPLFLVFSRRKKRRRLFEQSFPDALEMMRSAVQAGFGFLKAMQLVADESPDPMGPEFKKTAEEINLGLPLREALMNMNQRIDSVDLRLFSTAILIQRESGGNLAEILWKISTTIRERFKLVGQIRAFTAQGRFSGFVLGSLPFGFALMIAAIRPGYLDPLFNTKTGHTLIAVALMLQFLGYFIIKSILKIKLQ